MPHSGAVPVPKCRAASVSTSGPVPADAAAACRPHTQHHHTAAALMLTGLPCVQLPCRRPHAAPPFPLPASPVCASWLGCLRIPADTAVPPARVRSLGHPQPRSPRPCPIFEAPRHGTLPLSGCFVLLCLQLPSGRLSATNKKRPNGYCTPTIPLLCTPSGPLLS